MKGRLPRQSKHLRSEHRKEKPAKEAETDPHLFISSFIQQINIGHFLGARHCYTHCSHVQEAGKALSYGIVPKTSDSNKYSESEEGNVWTGVGWALE